MDEAVCVQHFYSAGNGQSIFDIAAGDTAELQNKHGANTLTSGRQAVMHGFKKSVVAQTRWLEIL